MDSNSLCSGIMADLMLHCVDGRPTPSSLATNFALEIIVAGVSDVFFLLTAIHVTEGLQSLALRNHRGQRLVKRMALAPTTGKVAGGVARVVAYVIICGLLQCSLGADHLLSPALRFSGLLTVPSRTDLLLTQWGLSPAHSSTLQCISDPVTMRGSRATPPTTATFRRAPPVA